MHARDDAPAETRARRAITRKRAGRRLSNGVVTVGDGVIVDYFFSGVLEPCVWSDTPIGPEMPG